jgi:hypothetical protein
MPAVIIAEVTSISALLPRGVRNLPHEAGVVTVAPFCGAGIGRGFEPPT